MLQQYIQSQKQDALKDNDVPGNKAGFLVNALDHLGSELLYNGGIGVLESLFTLDTATLAALLEWNRTNLLRIEQKQFIRRGAAFLIAALSVVAVLERLHVFTHPIVIDVLKLYARGLFQHWWVEALALVVAVSLELAVWRPGKLRVEHFGQMLAVAFAYVSNLPSELPKDAQTGETKPEGAALLS